jgi:hypothetical protein
MAVEVGNLAVVFVLLQSETMFHLVSGTQHSRQRGSSVLEKAR